MDRRSFTFKKEYYESLQAFPPAKRLAFYEAIARYSLYGEEPKLSGQMSAVFKLVRPSLDAEIRRSEEGRRSAEYQQWRSSVFVRDNFTCSACGSRGVKLNAHHIKRYCDYPDLRFDVDNGVTLCEECHKKLHRYEREVP